MAAGPDASAEEIAGGLIEEMYRKLGKKQTEQDRRVQLGGIGSDAREGGRGTARARGSHHRRSTLGAAEKQQGGGRLSGRDHLAVVTERTG